MTVPRKLYAAGALAALLLFNPSFGPYVSAQQPDGGDTEAEVQQSQQGQRGESSSQATEATGADVAETDTAEADAAEAAESATNDDASVETADGSESWQDIAPGAFDDFRPVLPVAGDAQGPTVLALQWMLERSGFAPGVLDGYWGSNTEQALSAFQTAHGLPVAAQADAATWKALREAVGEVSPLAEHEVSAATAEGPFVDVPEDYVKQADLDCLCFESMPEALAEELHTTVDVLKALNPDTDLASLAAGDTVLGPAVGGADDARGPGGDIASLEVSKSGFYLHALNAEGDVVYHFPTTVGADYDPSPDGEFKITAIATDPTFHYQPDHFADVPDDKPEAMLPAGPNNPVGVVWMQLSKDNYGIHGTAEPSTIGHTTSHGCVRLTNWDAAFLAQRVGQGVPVKFTGGGNGGESDSDEDAGDSADAEATE